MKKQSFPVTNIGSVSLLMVFIVLCLVTFATLSLSSAASDYRFSQSIAEHNSQYYEGVDNAAMRLKALDQTLQDAYKSNPAQYFQTVSSYLSKDSDLMIDFTPENPVVTFLENTSDTRAIKVSITLNKPEHLSKGYYRLTSFKEINTSEWKADNNLNLVK